MFLACFQLYPYAPKYDRNKYNYHYIKIEEQKIEASCRSIHISKENTAQDINSCSFQANLVNPDYSYTDYTSSVPFEVNNANLNRTQNSGIILRAPQDDEPFPGDPGQLSIADEIPSLLIIVSFFMCYKKISRINCANFISKMYQYSTHNGNKFRKFINKFALYKHIQNNKININFTTKNL